MPEQQDSDNGIPLDWASDVLPERCTEEEMDCPMTEIFWSWDGPEEKGESEEDPIWSSIA